jgi:hypothetical protein
MLDMVDCWKGKGRLVAEKVGKVWFLKEHIKDKESGIVDEVVHKVPELKVGILWNKIKNTVEIGKALSCKEVAALLGWENWKDLWRERKLYFAEYYFPVKVLEALGYIHYSGRGKITRIR